MYLERGENKRNAASELEVPTCNDCSNATLFVGQTLPFVEDPFYAPRLGKVSDIARLWVGALPPGVEVGTAA